MVTKTPAELAEMEAEIAAGKLPKNAMEEYRQQEAEAVFGKGFKRDKKGNPIEQGVGSEGHESTNHFNAIRKYEGEDAFWNAVAEIHKRDPKRHAALKLPVPRKAA